MVTSLIPVDVDELTAEWFSAVLGSEVTEATVLEASSGTTGRARVQLRGATSLPPTVFVKLRPTDEMQQLLVDLTGMGVAEARFYRDVAAEVPVRVPGVWFADTDDERYVMVLEDLTASGCTFPDPDAADIATRARDIVEQCARFHARYWESPRFAEDGDLAWFGARAMNDGTGGIPYVLNAVDAIGDRMDGTFHELAALYVEHAADITRLASEGARTLVHGDTHIGNLFVDEPGGGVTGFLDWAVVCTDPGMRDVSYVLCNSVPSAVREQIERDLIGRYCELLADEGIVLAPETAWEQHRLHAFYAWVAATTTAGMGDKWQSIEFGLAATRRTTVACAHLDTIGLLRERLGVTG